VILVWGIADDAPTAALINALAARGAPFVVIDQRNVLDTEIELTINGGVAGSLRCGRTSLDLGSITAAYIRPYDARRVPEVERAGEGSSAWFHALSVDDVLISFSETTAALVVNRPSAMASNGSKPFQSLWIKRAGFEVPETLVTTDPEAALDFWQLHGDVVYKSISGARSIVSRLQPDHVARLDDVMWCPTQFQQYVRGREYRVHVVGDEVLACEIESEADDYRYAQQRGADISIRWAKLTDDCADRCRHLVGTLGLALAGIDLRIGDDERWYCFEVNPSPGFSYYETATGQPIAAAVARLLAEAA
jgi:hypothetical protein